MKLLQKWRRPKRTSSEVQRPAEPHDDTWTLPDNSVYTSSDVEKSSSNQANKSSFRLRNKRQSCPKQQLTATRSNNDSSSVFTDDCRSYEDYCDYYSADACAVQAGAATQEINRKHSLSQFKYYSTEYVADISPCLDSYKRRRRKQQAAQACLSPVREQDSSSSGKSSSGSHKKCDSSHSSGSETHTTPPSTPESVTSLTTASPPTSPLAVTSSPLQTDKDKERLKLKIRQRLRQAKDKLESPTKDCSENVNRRALLRIPSLQDTPTEAVSPKRSTQAAIVTLKHSVVQSVRRPAAQSPDSVQGEDSHSSTSFELGVNTAQPPSVSPRRPIQRRSKRSSPCPVDEYSSHSSTSFELGSTVNADDEALICRPSSPGALRLTAAGLQVHERKSFNVAVEENPSSQKSDKFARWKRQQDKRKWYQEKHKARDEVLHKQSQQLQQRSCRPSNPFSSPCSASSTTSSPPRKTKLLAKLRSSLLPNSYDEVADFSLAPLSEMEHLSLKDRDASVGGETEGTYAVTATQYIAPPGGPKKQLLFGRVRCRKDNSSAVQEILERERRSVREAQRKQKIFEIQEHERIQRKRQAYLAMQRAKESGLPYKSMDPSQQNLSGDVEISTMSSSRTSTLPPCVVCRSAPRTHIATPCMHYAFCQGCVTDLQQQCTRKSSCPVCARENVAFAAVCV